MTDAPTKLVREKQNEGRLLLVSNRLPITIKRSDEGKFEMSMSSGGLVSGLSGLSKTTTFQWYGWPGLEVPEDEIPTLTTQLKNEHNAVPVMLDDELADRHYNGFSSRFHPTLSPPHCVLAILMLSCRRHHVAAFSLPPW
jgi:trehalose 6-phosphate synthase